MDPFIKTGEKRTLQLICSVLLVSLITIITYQRNVPEPESFKLILKILHFLLTASLLYAVYQGQQWARVLTVILFAIGALVRLYDLSHIGLEWFTTILALVQLLVYAVGIYHLTFSASFVAFQHWQQIGKRRAKP
ncbi:MAG: hypothetical protein RLP14_09870 [Owenweeksia sp.]